MQEDVVILTTAEVARLRVSTKTILTLARDGALPGEQVSRAWRFARAGLLDHIRGGDWRQAAAS